MSKRTYLLKIELDYIKPVIWRKIAVPADITLDDLHRAIQVAMGWDNAHLYMFMIKKKKYSNVSEHVDDGFMMLPQELDSYKYKLQDVVKRKGSKFRYVYDFGDSWLHYIKVEDSNFNSILPERKAYCLAGERNCPPEDIGGIPGYLRLIKALNDPTHSDHLHYKGWVGEDWDSEYFDEVEVTKKMGRLF